MKEFLLRNKIVVREAYPGTRSPGSPHILTKIVSIPDEIPHPWKGIVYLSRLEVGGNIRLLTDDDGKIMGGAWGKGFDAISEQDETVTRFYYIRDNENNPVVTVCIMKNGSKVSRGITVCSPADNFDKLIGRTRADIRARMALEKKGNALALSLSAPLIAALRQISASFNDVTILISQLFLSRDRTGFYSGVFNPVLTDFEKRVLEGK